MKEGPGGGGEEGREHERPYHVALLRGATGHDECHRHARSVLEVIGSGPRLTLLKTRFGLAHDRHGVHGGEGREKVQYNALHFGNFGCSLCSEVFLCFGMEGKENFE